MSRRSLVTGIAAVSMLATSIGTACSVSRPPEGASGAEIYEMLCANCHGGDLEGRVGPPLGPGSNSADRPDSFLETTIEHGRGRMPSFEASLSTEQLDRLISHIREVQRG